MDGIKVKQIMKNDFTGVLFEEKLFEQLVYEWIQRKRVYSDFYLTDLIIQDSATKFRNALKMTWFLPDEQWVKKFRTNFNILQTKMTKYLKADKKSLLHLDIIRDLWLKKRSKIGSRVKESAGIEIIVIDDEIKEECPDQKPDIDEIETAEPDTGEEICSTSSEHSTENAKQKVIDFENELPGSVVRHLNNPSLPAEVKTEDLEDYIPDGVCTPEKVDTADVMENIIYKDDHDMKTEIMSEQPEQMLQNQSVSSLKISKVVSLHRSNNVPVKINRKRKSLPTERLGVDKSSKAHDNDDIPKALNSSITPINSISSVVSTPEAAVLTQPSTITCAFQLPSTIKIKKLTPPTQSRPKTKFSEREPLKTRTEALKCIKLMEEFAMMKENFRLIGFIDRLEKLIKKTD